MEKKVSQKEINSAILILIGHCINLKAQSIRVDETFKGYFFDIDFKVNQVKEVRSGRILISKENSKVMQEFEKEITNIVKKDEKIVVGEVKEIKVGMSGITSQKFKK